MAEVEKLARIKEKQEEDKSAARLHSFRYVLQDFMLEKSGMVVFMVGQVNREIID